MTPFDLVPHNRARRHLIGLDFRATSLPEIDTFVAQFPGISAPAISSQVL
jgi:hypothetical protein